MSLPVEPKPEPIGAGAALLDPDPDASLSVDQVSEDPPAAHVLALPCRDALAQSAACPLGRAKAARRIPPARAGIPATTAARATARLTPRPSKAGGRATLTGGTAKGELVSLDGAEPARADLLVLSCTERGPQLPLTGKKAEAIEPDDDELEEIEFLPSPSIPVAISEPPPSVGKPSRPPRSAPPIEIRTPTAEPASAAPSAATLPSASAGPPSSLRGPASGRAPGSKPGLPAPRLTPLAGEPPKPIGLISDFDELPPLDPLQALDIGLKPPRPTPRTRIHPKAAALFGGLFGLAIITTVLAFAIRLGPEQLGLKAAGSASAGKAPARPSADPARPASSGAGAASSAAREPEAPPPEPGPWRVSSMATEDGIKLITGKLGTKSLTTALEDEHVPKAQIARILKAFDDAKIFDKPKKSHQFVVALERESKKVKAFEYQASSTEVWQAREVDEKLTGTKLDLKIEQRKLARGVVVKEELKSSLVEAGFDDDMVSMLDDSIGDRVSLERLGKGTSLRIVAQEQLVAGRFSKYLAIDAVEYRLPRSEKKVRLYSFRNGKSAGVFDGNGKAPFRSSWGPPLKVVRVTSKFNPKRMHPVLHVVMPHNGADFGAPMGTPVYAVAAGTLSHVGPQGPSGNLVLVEHAGGLESGYAHLSRFATGLKKGDKVEAQQLVGYVGSTGRSTGPHLHFSMKRAGAFIDPLSVIKLNQERVVPKADREAFDAFKAEMDKLLDGIELSDQPAEAGAGAGAGGSGDADDNNDRDDNNHGDEDDKAAPAASGSAAPSPAEPPPAPKVTDDTTPESAVWRPD